MKVGIIIPDRGDRPRFLANLQRMLAAQTVQPNIVCTMCYNPESDRKDITQRYRRGYDELRNQNIDVIFLIEVDDYYAPNYIESMLAAWIYAGKPDLFGTRHTIYYHISLFKGYVMHHETRSSAMSTMIKPDLNFAWCPDHEPYTDSWLYSILRYKLWDPPKPGLDNAHLVCPVKPICIGIKHGVGLTGGEAHTTRLNAYTDYPTSFDDKRKDWLRSCMDAESFEFYANYFA